MLFVVSDKTSTFTRKESCGNGALAFFGDGDPLALAETKNEDDAIISTLPATLRTTLSAY